MCCRNRGSVGSAENPTGITEHTPKCLADELQPVHQLRCVLYLLTSFAKARVGEDRS